MLWRGVYSLLVVVFMMPLPLHAAEQKLGTAAIESILAGTLVKSDVPETSWSQFFGRDGSTEYSQGSSPAFGSWKAEAGQYCSVWPPVKLWVCYDVYSDQTADGHERIIWVSEKGARTTGIIEKE